MKTKNFKTLITSLSILSVVSILIAGTALAGSIKERMKARQPQIIALKAAGIIGENNLGYLEYRDATEPHKELIKADNQDRAAVYNAIARQQQTTPENVGRRRAAQIAEIAPTGTWLQNPQGEWYRK